MAERYAALLDSWKSAGERARQAQRVLDERFDAFLRGEGPEPDEQERVLVRKLHAEEQAALQAALDYVQASVIRK
ncbi:hypothetical protein [Ramlibacter albus]|uniref:Uncharacterized protein n=1 Tax=Ramlibacter albus TaxID=2079448 RepID=A0A923S5H4_9BURK|nr:hypothetical protein [Ramlibacter albus]MBC5768575.1 hypothetical protein [Ramlibacter albus]